MGYCCLGIIYKKLVVLVDIRFDQNCMTLGRKQGLLVLCLVYITVLVPFLPKNNNSNDSHDHVTYHMPTIQRIMQHFPRVDLKEDPQSAVSPGYNYFLAGLSVGTSLGETGLRVAHVLISFLLPAYLYRKASEKLVPSHALLLVLPLVLSPYFLKAAAWIVTDNPALLGMSFILAGTLGCRGSGGRWLLPFVSALTVWVRQMYIWLIIPQAVLIVMEPASGTYIQKLGRVFLSSLPALLVLGWLVYSWQGLVPPRWHEASLAWSMSATLYSLALMTWILAPAAFLCGIPVKGFERGIIITSGMLGVLLAVSVRSDFSMEEGRWGGLLWDLARRAPVFHGRSLIFLILVPVGGILLSLVVLGLWRRHRLHGFIWFFSLFCWLASFLPNRQVFHRYFEPSLYIFALFAVVLIVGGTAITGKMKDWRWIQGGVAGLQIAALTVLYMRYYP